MNKHYKLLAVLSTAAAMSAATPALALSIPGSVSTVLAATAGWLNEDGELRYKDSEGLLPDRLLEKKRRRVVLLKRRRLYFPFQQD